MRIRYSRFGTPKESTVTGFVAQEVQERSTVYDGVVEKAQGTAHLATAYLGRLLERLTEKGLLDALDIGFVMYGVQGAVELELVQEESEAQGVFRELPRRG